MQRSASALFEAGNTLDESIALITGANTVVQNPEQVGTALKTLALRLRGAKVELEEAGEDVEGMAESTSQLQAKLKALTHGRVDIMLDADSFKNTTQILREMAGAWEYMTDIERASALELMGGKRQANILASVIKNFDTVEDVIETSSDASGSALAENEKYLDSIQGKIDQFNNSLQTMWMNFLNADAIKFFVDAGTFLVNAVDNIGLIQTALVAIVGYLTFIKKMNWSDMFKGFKNPVKEMQNTFSSGFKNGIKNIFNGTAGGGLNLLGGADLEEEINNLNNALKQGPDAFNAYKEAQKSTNNGMYQMIQTTDKAEYTTNDYTAALKNMSPAAIQAAQKQQMLNFAIGAIAMVVTTAISLISNYINGLKTLEEEYEELKSSIADLESEINSIDSELKTVEERIDALSNKNLSLTEAEELRKLKEQSAELERQKKLQEDILEVREKQNHAKSLAMINNMLKTTAAGQEQAAESAKTWGSVIGGVVLAAVGAVAAYFTAGSSLMLTAAGIGMMAGTATGGAIGEWVGNATHDISSSEAAKGLIEWYESYEKAIEEAAQKASAAEQEYFSNATDGNYEKWQKRAEELNKLQTQMYDGLENLQEYIGNLEYDDSTKGIIDGYNDLMTHLSVKADDGNINAQIKSIESLASEYYQLSRGVDENGKNVALSAEEYARYCDIVEQILAYTPELIVGYDEEGNAILGAADAQYTYNQLLIESIALLKERNREAAANMVSDDSIDDVVESTQDEYDDAVKNAKRGQPNSIDQYATNGTGDNGKMAAWSVANTISSVEAAIGEKKGWFESDLDYYTKNIDAIAKNREKILSYIKYALLDKGVGEDMADAWVEDYAAWIDGMYEKIQSAEDQANAKIRERLYMAPQSVEGYNDLSGSQLAFVNNYIAGLTDLKDKSAKEIKQIRDDIVNMTDGISNSEVGQQLIDNLFALDPSKMPVKQYEAKVNEIFGDIIDEGIITEDQKAAIFNQMFGDVDTDTMLETVKAKLKDTSKALADNLTLSELKIAFKYRAELEDGSMSYEDLKRKIAELSGGIDGPIVESYSTLKQQVADFNELMNQSEEIVTDNTKVTQEYKDSLVALGITEEELATCFDDTNKLVVTNAKKLKELTNRAKKNTGENIRLARSQSMLQYYEKFKEMQSYIDAQGNIVDGKKDEIIALNNEMNALEKVIAKYSILEAQLLGTTNAYEKFQAAQTADSEVNFEGQAEEMMAALGEAFSTAKLGTETAQAAIAGLVPESVYKDLDTLDDKMSAIYKYFKEGKLSKYFTLEFDEDGGLSSAEMKLGNMRKFIEDGLGDQNGDGISVFSGKNWKNFELNQEWIDSLPEGTDKLQALADEFGVTKDVAFAFLKTLEDHDIEWLNGDHQTLLDELVPDTLEYDLYEAMNGISDLNAQLANGEIDAKEYAEKLKELNKQLVESKTKSRTNLFGEDGYSSNTPTEIKNMDLDGVDNYLDADQKVKDADGALSDAMKQYEDALESVAKAKEENRNLTKEEKDAIDEAEKAVDDAADKLDAAIKKRDEFTKPSEVEIRTTLDDINSEIDETAENLDKKLASGEHTITVEVNGKKIEKEVTSTEQLLNECFHQDDDGYWVINSGVDLTELQTKYPEIQTYVSALNSRTQLTAYADTSQAQDPLQTLNDTLANIQRILETVFQVKVDTDGAVQSTSKFKEMWDGIKSKTITLWQKVVKKVTGDSEANGTANVSGTAYATGTAHKSGDWGLPKAEHGSLVGELGPEMVVDPRSGRYYTVGDAGAEMVNLPKGAIIFNHKQTEGLLQNGHITSRGKAYAEGNAHLTIWPNASSKKEWTGTGYSGPNSSGSRFDDTSGSSKVTDELREVFDWIEVRLEEITKNIDLRSAKLENQIGHDNQNKVVNEMLDLNKKLYDNLIAGANEYYSYSEKLLAKIPAEYREAAKDGAIAIEEFYGEADEKTLEAIQKYREWIQKADDATQQAEEVLTEISNLAKQAIDNIATDYENKNSQSENKKDQYEAYNEFIETDQGFASEEIYRKMMEANNESIQNKQKQRDDMLSELNRRVEAGEIEVGSQNWYDAVNDIAAVDAEIIELKTDNEDLQDSINELHWDKFDALMGRIESVSEEAENLIDVLSSKDMVDESGNWTDEGLTTLGLHAQRMEAAEVKAKKLQDEIDYLNANWQELGYTEEEYIEKLGELKDEQYDAIKVYDESKEAIVELNEERIDAIKEGIEKEIEAYEELIEKKKEELSAEKDLYDFQKSIMEQEKDLADIDRQLAALAGDNSASARAKRAQLEAERAEKQAALEDSYYDRSVAKQEEALDKELENFQDEKEKEMEGWDEYLENTEKVVEDSLNTIKNNTYVIYQTLTEMGEEYGLSITESLTSPWKEGEGAIQSFSEKFGLSMSATVEELTKLEEQFKKAMSEIDKAGSEATKKVDKNAEDYTKAEYKKPEEKPEEEKPKEEETKTITVGGKINATGAKIYDYAGDKSGEKQYYSKDPIYVVLSEKNGYLKVRHHTGKSAIGWFKKSDVKAYAKGTIGVDDDQLALIDELGEELVLHANNGRLSYLTKGTGVVPADMTSNLMAWGKLDPQIMLDSNRPTIMPNKNIINTEVNLDCSVGTLVNIERCEQGTLPDVEKIVNKALEKHTQRLNQSLRKFTR